METERYRGRTLSHRGRSEPVVEESQSTGSGRPALSTNIWYHTETEPEQRAWLPTVLAKGAEAFGFREQVWITERVSQMIQQQLGVNQ